MASIRGRAGFRGRGRGGNRGRGGVRSGSREGKRGFAAARTREEVDDSPFIADEQSGSEESDTDISDESDLEDGAQPASNAYAQFMKSIASRNILVDHIYRKKRKLRHDEPGDDDLQIDATILARNVEGNIARGKEYPVVDDKPTSEGALENILADVPDADDLGEEGYDEDEKDGDFVFDKHFASPDEEELVRRIKQIGKNEWITKKLDMGGGRGVLQVPTDNQKAISRKSIESTRDINLKARLIENAQKKIGELDNMEKAIAPSIFEYQDLLFGARTLKNAGRLRDLVCIHALNHILMTRDRVLKNNAKLAAATEDSNTEYRDQGFTRPKILFLLETKQACVRALDSITKFYDFEQQENKKRFLDSFSQPENKFSPDSKPADFRALFEGNDDNDFRIGIKITRKTLKLYSTFYNSDIVFASALGLRRAIESPDPKKRDSDFLSSIELVVMEQADATLMQNWEHAEHVFMHLNLQPKDAHGCDFSRVRPWYLDGYARYLRQTIVLSAYITPNINALFNTHMRNAFGRFKFTPHFTDGILTSLHLPTTIKQTFHRFPSPSHTTDPDARFTFFSSAILPLLSRLPKGPEDEAQGILLFIPTYHDFLRLRNSLVDTDLAFTSLSEYTPPTDVRKARSYFMSGRHSLLLYTGRAHHFHRYRLRGVKRVVFYGVPENPVWYEEVLGWLGASVERGEVGGSEGWVKVLFSRWEGLELERVVGRERAGRMIRERGDVFDFV